MGKDGHLDAAKAQLYFGDYGVGSVLSSPMGGCVNASLSATSVAGWRMFVEEYQAYVLANVSGGPRVPLLWGLDSTRKYTSNLSLLVIYGPISDRLLAFTDAIYIFVLS